MEKEKLKPYYHVLGFCNGELMYYEKKESSTEVEITLAREPLLEDPLIIYGYEITNYFKINSKGRETIERRTQYNKYI